MFDNINECIEYVKKQSILFYSIANDKQKLYEEINKLKLSSDLNKLLDFYKGHLGSLNILRLVVLEKLKKGILITENMVMEIKDKFNIKDLEYFKEYVTQDILDYITNYKTPKGKDPFKSWKDPFRIFYEYFLKFKKEQIDLCLNKIGNKLIEDLNITNYITQIYNFDGVQNQGLDHCGLCLFPKELEDYKNAFQLSFNISNNKLFAETYKGKEVLDNKNFEHHRKECSDYNTILQTLGQYALQITDLNNVLIENKKRLTNNKDLFDKENKIKDENNYKQKNINTQPLNQILYGPPGTGKTYNTVIKAMEIISFEDMFKDWYLSIYCKDNKVQDKDSKIKEYINHINKINNECDCLKADNIFKYYEIEKFKKLQEDIRKSEYMTENKTRNYESSYYQHCLKRYEEFLKWLTYEEIKKEFDKLKQAGQIEFITFHQSYSYEEFIEGIKPDIKEWETEADKITYIGKNGILKDISNSAKSELIKNTATNNINLKDANIFKMSLGNTKDDNDTNIFDYCIENNVVAIGYGNEIDFTDCKNENDIKNILNNNTTELNDNKKSIFSRISTFKFSLKNNDIILISNGNNNIRAIAQVKGEYFFDNNTEIKYNHFRKVKWLYIGENISVSTILKEKILSQKSIYKFNDEDINFVFLNQILKPSIDYKPKPYILIIDEINRGNISKIFGEMITLIEEDKRIGNEHELKLTLPYSKEPFGIPKNLYVIGTMNTSDRSIASVDIALRRRFKFIEMMPKEELVTDIPIENDKTFRGIFKALNEKITILLDRDHQIGHSYFLEGKINNIEDLKNVWFNEILPLLNEYFYNDWEKLQALLGEASKNNDSFIVVKETKLPFYQYDIEDKVYDFIDKKNLNNENFKLALLKIIEEPKQKQKEINEQ